MITEFILQKALAVAKTGDWDQANEILDGFGIEHVSCGDRKLKYINLGDTYDGTVCEEAGKVFHCSWGSWYEQTEIEYCQRTKTIRCGYCSKFTPMNKTDWQEVICENCENLVGG